MLSRAGVAEAVRSRLWPLPMFALAAALACGIAMPEVDAALDTRLPGAVERILFGGGADAAREVLSAIAGSLITVTSLTFSLTLITLQLASSQYSPRLLRTFAADQVVQRTLALFLATFVYALTVLRTIRSNDESADFVPQLSVTIAYVLAVVSVGALVMFLAHLVRQIRVESLLDQVCGDTVATAARMLRRREDGDAGTGDPQAVTPPGRGVVIESGTSGFLVEIDEADLLATAVRHDVVLRMDRPVGSPLTAGVPAARCWPGPGTQLDDQALRDIRQHVSAALRTGPERTSAQDPEYGLRQLVDVVIRALSPGINDPTTAVHGLHSCTVALSELLGYHLGPHMVTDEHGDVRVVIIRSSFAELLALVCAQPRLYGADDPAVRYAMLTLLHDLAWKATLPDHRAAIAEQLTHLRRVAPQDVGTVDAQRTELLYREVLSVLDRQRDEDQERS
ncbi:DUF2254 domain-containing protein [Mycolicibacterium monacense]|uniref:DUF2254 domain-containing protein n=3 Tax=Mycobacteriaceae TaxID=1762 RepID=A0AAD1IU60_MYCMB|nr:DUF2254 domain-containing protein [Mycolicibacterium monacense]MDA4101004.1 membrane protein [Mycolicibacterium monacense DSM 44395]ORB19765.1 hypothetical protein BST34_14215 [Mycolicibacterium monacense DSM 44395]QHP86392.1 DUF2254 domain-containing protein [Mycolicibacterium monacense DSM 44395]BBZ60584.1 hypothetical protein MMON_18850 [Mycolicibacterium monacense]